MEVVVVKESSLYIIDDVMDGVMDDAWMDGVMDLVGFPL